MPAFLLLQVLVALLLVDAQPSLYVASPAQGAAFLLDAGSSELNIPFQYQVFGAQDQGWAACLELRHSKTGEVHLPLSCVSSSSIDQVHAIQLKQIMPGSYELRTALKAPAESDPRQETSVVSYFQVLAYEDAVPTLQISSDRPSFTQVATYQSGTADFSLQFDFLSQGLDVAHFTLCLQVRSAQSGQDLVPFSCLANTDRSFTLRNLSPGKFTLSLSLQDTRPPPPQRELRNAILAQKAIVRELHVPMLQEAWPMLNLPHQSLEFAADPRKHTTTAVIPYKLEGEASALDQVKVCIELFHIVGEKNLLLPKTCVAASQQDLTLSHLPTGVVQAVLSVESLQGGMVGSTVTVHIESRDPEEFVPSYQWQRLRAWQTIPSGLQTRLPVGGTAVKEARIPEPWRLQLAMPSPCKYFLRMDVHRSTSIHQIQEEANKRCAVMPAPCFQVVVNGKVVQDASSTVEVLGLFNAEKHLVLDETCVADKESPSQP